MARSFPQKFLIRNSTSFSNTTASFFIMAAALAIASVISFLCTSHKHLKMSSRGSGKKESMLCPISPPKERKPLATFSDISSKALVVAKMISWKKVSSSEGEEEKEKEELWKKTILMGERCRPLDFSGKIVYDSEGNQVVELTPRSPVSGVDSEARVSAE